MRYLILILLFMSMSGWAVAEGPQGSGRISEALAGARDRLPVYADAVTRSSSEDWLITDQPTSAGVYRDGASGELVLANGLLQRRFRLAPDGACVGYDNLMTGESVLRAVDPEVEVILDGVRYPVGGLKGQEEFAYLRPERVDAMTSDPGAFHLVGIDTGRIEARFPWKRVRPSEEKIWPPPGVVLRFHYEAPTPRHAGVKITVHHALYDGLPVGAKWFTLENGSSKSVRLDRFTADILSAVEFESDVERPERWEHPNLHVETDFSCGGFSPKSANQTVRWTPDSRHLTQVNYQRKTPNRLIVQPPRGPEMTLAPGEKFNSFRTWQLVHDSTDRERRGLAVRRMYRTIAPWVTENPVLMHVRRADPASVRLAIDQCAAVGFEMVILTFGSGFDIENEDPAYRAGIKKLVDYAHEKGVELGGYSLLASRRISDEHDVVNPETGRPGGFAKFGNSPCLESQWGRDYFRKLESFIVATGLDLLEHDGNYPGDHCASTIHPGHAGLGDSQWRQFERIQRFYRWCRARGVYLNVPDWYYLNGSNKCGMGYRETNWSLPRARQVILARQNIFDGTWGKTPSMGWMFVPLVQYHGGGAAATLEPLREHLDAYEDHLAYNFGAGVQACYRGPRLFDAPETKALVKRWVDFFKRHRRILESDIIHFRRADGRDIDGFLHVNPSGKERGLAMIFNPTDKPVAREIVLPLYYTGLTRDASVSIDGGAAVLLRLDRAYEIRLSIEVPAGGRTWILIESP